MGWFLEGFDVGRELLKWTAIITMTVDHIGAVLYQDLDVLRIIGRLAFPLFAYLLVLGIENTHNIRNYFLRLTIFAFISQVPFFLAIDAKSFEKLNIFFTLATGLLFVYLLKRKSVFAMVPVLISLVIPFDYGVYGIAIIGCMYILRGNMKFGVVSLVLLNMLFLLPPSIQFLSIAAIPLIVLHNICSQKTVNTKKHYARIPAWRKYFFYIYYPLHLTILYAIKIYFIT